MILEKLTIALINDIYCHIPVLFLHGEGVTAMIVLMSDPCTNDFMLTPTP